MATMQINRDVPVQASDGEVGRVKHVVLDHDTKEVTDLIIEGPGGHSIVPIGTVVEAESERIILGVSRAEVARQPFEPEQYHGIDETAVREESQHRATHGGAALLDARQDAVEVAPQSGTASRPPAPATGALPYELRRHGSQPVASTGRLQRETESPVPSVRLPEQKFSPVTPASAAAAHTLPPVVPQSTSAPHIPPVPPLNRPLASSSSGAPTMPAPPMPPAAIGTTPLHIPPAPINQHIAAPAPVRPLPPPATIHAAPPSSPLPPISPRRFEETAPIEVSESRPGIVKRASLIAPALVLPAVGVVLGIRYARLTAEQRRMRIMGGTLVAVSAALSIVGLIGRRRSQRVIRVKAVQSGPRRTEPNTTETADHVEMHDRRYPDNTSPLHQRPLTPAGTGTAAPLAQTKAMDRSLRD